MRRREFIAGIAGAVAWPLAARAQQRALPGVGYINAASREERNVEAFLRGLRETGFVQGQNVVIDYRFAENQRDRVPQFVVDFIRQNVAVIVSVGGTEQATTVKAAAATSRIPVVFTTGADPVQNGLVASLNHPGGDLTGVNMYIADLWPKQFDLLANLLPNSHVFAILFSGGTSSQLERLREQAQPAADKIGKKLVVLTAFTPQEIEGVFSQLVRQRVDALAVAASPLAYARRDVLTSLAARYAIPTMYAFREAIEAGGLVSYGVDIPDVDRLLGVYVGRILKGEKPSNLPVVQPTKFDLAINLKTAKALGLTIPPNLLALADQVIE
jgi:putative tryptophan/tyrosine transport system substrate-binding protein